MYIHVTATWANKKMDGDTDRPYVVEIVPFHPVEREVGINILTVEYCPGDGGVRTISRDGVVATAGGRVHIVFHNPGREVIFGDDPGKDSGHGDRMASVNAANVEPAAAYVAVSLLEECVVEGVDAVGVNAFAGVL